jgi:adenylyltransferase/sulfurtransferase
VDYDEFCAPRGAQNGAQPGVTQITARELAAWRTDEKRLALVDVREPWEWNLGHISGATLLPLSELARSVASLDPSMETVVYCHLGTRSQAAAERLIALGFRRVYNLAGGIDAWSSDVDPGIPRY